MGPERARFGEAIQGDGFNGAGPEKKSEKSRLTFFAQSWNVGTAQEFSVHARLSCAGAKSFLSFGVVSRQECDAISCGSVKLSWLGKIGKLDEL